MLTILFVIRRLQKALTFYHVSSFKELSSTHSSSVLCKIRVWIQMKLRPYLDAPKS
jgi:hypothetical protein